MVRILFLISMFFYFEHSNAGVKWDYSKIHRINQKIAKQLNTNDYSAFLKIKNSLKNKKDRKIYERIYLAEKGSKKVTTPALDSLLIRESSTVSIIRVVSQSPLKISFNLGKAIKINPNGIADSLAKLPGFFDKRRKNSFLDILFPKAFAFEWLQNILGNKQSRWNFLYAATANYYFNEELEADDTDAQSASLAQDIEKFVSEFGVKSITCSPSMKDNHGSFLGFVELSNGDKYPAIGKYHYVFGANNNNGDLEVIRCHDNPSGVRSCNKLSFAEGKRADRLKAYQAANDRLKEALLGQIRSIGDDDTIALDHLKLECTKSGSKIGRFYFYRDDAEVAAKDECKIQFWNKESGSTEANYTAKTLDAIKDKNILTQISETTEVSQALSNYWTAQKHIKELEGFLYKAGQRGAFQSLAKCCEDLVCRKQALQEADFKMHIEGEVHETVQ